MCVINTYINLQDSQIFQPDFHRGSLTFKVIQAIHQKKRFLTLGVLKKEQVRYKTVTLKFLNSRVKPTFVNSSSLLCSKCIVIAWCSGAFVLLEKDKSRTRNCSSELNMLPQWYLIRESGEYLFFSFTYQRYNEKHQNNASLSQLEVSTESEYMQSSNILICPQV